VASTEALGLRAVHRDRHEDLLFVDGVLCAGGGEQRALAIWQDRKKLCENLRAGRDGSCPGGNSSSMEHEPTNERIDNRALLKHSAWIDRVARALVRDGAARDDVIQEAWLSALSRPPAKVANVRGWLGAVVRNTARQLGRGDARRTRREHASISPPPSPSAQELAAQAELSRRVVDAVLQLEEPYRETVLLRFFEGKSSAEIARLRDVPESTVRNRLRRALDRLRVGFESESDDRRGLLALLPLAVRSETATLATASVAAVLTKGVIMSIKAKILVAAAIVLLAAGAWWHESGRPAVADRERVAAVPALPEGPTRVPAAAIAPTGESDAEPAARELEVATADPVIATTEVRGLVRFTGLGTPVVDATVELLENGETVLAATETGADGRFTLEGAPIGTAMTARAIRPNHRPAEASVRVEGPQAEELLIWVEPGHAAPGRIFDAITHRPIEGARVEIDRDPVATSDENGRFRVNGVNGASQLDVEVEGYASTRRFFDVDALGHADVVAIPMLVGASLEGIVRGDDGAPIHGARVDLERGLQRIDVEGLALDDDLLFEDGETRSVSSDEEGRFRLERLIPGERELVVSAPRHVLRRVTVVIPRPGSAVSRDVALRRSFSIEGTITVNGTPAEMTSLSWAGATTTGHGVANGSRYEFANVEPGPVTLTARLRDRSLPTHTFELEGKAGETFQHDIAFELPIVTVGGVAVDDHGAPIAGLRVAAMTGRFSPWLHATTGDDGRFHVQTYGTETTRFSVSGTSRRTTVRVADIAPGRTDVVLRFSPTRHLAVRPIDAVSGAPIKRFLLYWHDAESRHRAWHVEEDGTARFTTPEASVRLTINAMDAGYRPVVIDDVKTVGATDAAPFVVHLERGCDLRVRWVGDHATFPNEPQTMMMLLPEGATPPRVEFGAQPGEATTIDSESSAPLFSQYWVRVPETLHSTIRGLAPGRYAFQFWPDIVEFTPSVIDVPAALTHEVEVDFRRVPERESDQSSTDSGS